jgi:catechol 2,3-dioxygenase
MCARRSKKWRRPDPGPFKEKTGDNMLKVSRPTPSHFGIFVTDVPRMVAFYTEVFGLTQTDTGTGRTFKNTLVFLSASQDQHHQLVIAGGRPPEATFSTVMQLSFAVPSIQHLRDIRVQSEARGASKYVPLNHGNALSLYFADPEGNTVEAYIDMPFYIAQPHGSFQGRRHADARDRGHLPRRPDLHAAGRMAGEVRQPRAGIQHRIHHRCCINLQQANLFPTWSFHEAAFVHQSGSRDLGRCHH